MASTRISDIIVPELFTPYVQQVSAEKSALVASGALVREPSLDMAANEGSKVVNVPSFKDITNEAEDVGSDDPDTSSTPKKIGTSQELAPKLFRNASWSSMGLAALLAGASPFEMIGNRTAAFWAKRLQAAWLAYLAGIFADNDAAPAGTEHVQYDLTYSLLALNGGVFKDGLTNFSAEAMIDAAQTMGDASDELGLVWMHSVVAARAKKLNLIDAIPDSEGPIKFQTYLGHAVIIDDGMPASSGTYDTYLLAPGALRYGVGDLDAAAEGGPATEIDRKPAAGNGSGETILHNRNLWLPHLPGHKYAGTYPTGGPTNAATSNNLAAAGSWLRVFPERKQIKIARLRTREAAA